MKNNYYSINGKQGKRKAVPFMAVIFSLIFLFSISFSNALPDDSGTAINFDYPINYSTINVNNSQYLQGLTPTEIANLFDDSNLVPYTGATQDVDLGSYGLTADTIGIISSGLLDVTPTGSADLKSLVNKEYVDLAVTSLGAAYYMRDEDDSTGYKTCYLNPSSDAETYIEGAGLVDDDYLGGWISATDEAPKKLLKGVYDWYITSEKTSGTKDLRIYWKLVERKSDDSEVVIATSSSSNEIDEKANYLVPLQLNDDYTLDAGSRIIGKLYADVSGGGSSPTIRIYYQGDTSSRWEIPANSEIFQNIFVPYSGAVKDVNLSQKSLTANNITSIGAIKAPSGTSRAPSFAFTSEPNLGIYRKGWHVLSITYNGNDISKFSGSDGSMTTAYNSLKLVRGGTSPNSKIDFQVYDRSAGSYKTEMELVGGHSGIDFQSNDLFTTGGIGIGTTDITGVSANNRLTVARESANVGISAEVAADAPTNIPFFQVAKSRGTLSSKSAVQDGDELGGWYAGGYDGSAYDYPLKFGGRVDGISGGVVGGRWDFYTQEPSGSRTLRMSIRGNGTVEIYKNLNVTDEGSFGSTYKAILGGSDYAGYFLDADDNYVTLLDTSGASEFYNSISGNQVFLTSEDNAIDAYGNANIAGDLILSSGGSANIGGDLLVYGTATIDTLTYTSSDPELITFYPITQERAIYLLEHNTPPEKWGGISLYYDNNTRELRAISHNGDIYRIDMEKIGNARLQQKAEYEERYVWDSNTGKTKRIQIIKKRYRIPEGYKVNSTSGELIRLTNERK